MSGVRSIVSNNDRKNRAFFLLGLNSLLNADIYYCNNLSLFWGLMSMLQTGHLNNALGLHPRALSSYPVHTIDIRPQNSDKLLLKYPKCN